MKWGIRRAESVNLKQPYALDNSCLNGRKLYPFCTVEQYQNIYHHQTIFLLNMLLFCGRIAFRDTLYINLMQIGSYRYRIGNYVICRSETFFISAIGVKNDED